MHSTKHWISIFLGIALIAVGILPLLSILNIVGVDFSTFFGKLVSIFAYIAAFGGFYLIIDSFHELGSFAPTMGWISLIVGFAVFAFGIIQLLVTWSVLGWSWWPEIPEVFYYALFILEGILLFIAGFLD